LLGEWTLSRFHDVESLPDEELSLRKHVESLCDLIESLSSHERLLR